MRRNDQEVSQRSPKNSPRLIPWTVSICSCLFDRRNEDGQCCQCIHPRQCTAPPRRGEFWYSHRGSLGVSLIRSAISIYNYEFPRIYQGVSLYSAFTECSRCRDPFGMSKTRRNREQPPEGNQALDTDHFGHYEPQLYRTRSGQHIDIVRPCKDTTRSLEGSFPY
jgi:hypothetical protein